MKDNPKKTDVARQVELFIRRLNSLSTLPEVAASFLANFTSGKNDLEALTEIIESDPALTAKILSLAHTEGINFKDGSPSVRQALDNLPSSVVRDAMISVKVFQAFDVEYDPDSKRLLPRKQLALHALATACCAKMIAELFMPPEDQHMAFSAGLLHDIGKLAIDQVMPKSFERIIQQAFKESVSLYTIEQQHLGLDHMLIGKRLAEKWHLPQEIVYAIWMHHSDTETIAQHLPLGRIAQVVRLADIIARQCQIGHSGSCDTPESPAEILDRLSISNEQYETIRNSLPDEVARRSELLGLQKQGGATTYCQALKETTEQLSSNNTQIIDSNKQLSISSSQLKLIKDFQASITVEMAPIEAARCFAVLCQKHYHMGPALIYLVNDDETLIEAVIIDASGNAETKFINVDEGSKPIPPEIRTEFNVLEASGNIEWLLEQSKTDIAIARTKIAPLIADNKAIGVLAFEQRLPVDIVELSRSLETSMSLAAGSIQLISTCHAQRTMNEQFVSILGELKDSRQHLVQARSLAGLAEMAAGAAHELNNPLAVISGRAQLLLGVETDDNKKQMLQQIQARTSEIANIVEDLMSFARPKQPDRKSFILRKVIEASIQQTAANLKLNQIEASIEGIDIDCDVIMDGQQIITALINILTNALESYPGNNGPVTIKESATKTEGFATFDIIDNGCGMNADILAKAADPFFSEKPAGRKRGMGLTQARRLIELNDGSLQIASQPLEGTKITVKLPLA